MGLRSSKVKNEPENSYSITNNPMESNVCRICLESDEIMIRPCACSGSIEAVHEKCMISWITSKLCHKHHPQIKC